jgi:hypothetical protein
MLPNFSSPEEAYETAHRVRLTNDIELYSKCFLKPADQQTIKQLQTLGGFPKAVKFIEHKVLEKEIINKYEINLRVREVGKGYPLLTKSPFILYYYH